VNQKVFVHGFPGLYGGAGTELHHQIPIWQKLGLDVNLIPSMPGFRQDPLFPEMVQRGITIHEMNHFGAIEKNAPVIGFCSRPFLSSLDVIRRYSQNTVFVNCMTWLFPEEKRRQAEGKIKTFLYQNEDVRRIHAPFLRGLNRNAGSKFLTFVPFFDAARFPFIGHRNGDFFGCGRISRQDQDKYSRQTLGIYESFISPVPKVGLFVGFDVRSQKKVGLPPPWIITARDQRAISQQVFYRHAEVVLQPTDTTENWPRVGLEAMSSGSVLIVDNRGGWRRMIQHGRTGFLCNSAKDFIYYASKMAYEPGARLRIAEQAHARGKQLASEDASKESWKQVFEQIV
jgi:Glycosyl transferases group 1